MKNKNLKNNILLVFSLVICFASVNTFAQGVELKAKNGNVSAMYKLAGEYYKGIGRLQDYKQAFIWYKQAADKNNLESCYMTASMYEEGKGVTENKTNAFNYYIKAAERGHEKSQFKVATMFDEGIGTTMSKSRAYLWYRICAERNEVLAQRRMGDFYFYGEAVNEDWSEALYWYDKAVSNNDTISMGNLSYILYANKSVAPDYKRADALAKIAIQKDVPMAQYVYAELLNNGFIETKNTKKANEYYRLAAGNGVEQAKEVLAIEKYKNTGDLTDIISLREINKGETYLILAKEFEADEQLVKSKKSIMEYYKKAAELNNPEAIKYLEEINNKNKKKRK